MVGWSGREDFGRTVPASRPLQISGPPPVLAPWLLVALGQSWWHLDSPGGFGTILVAVGGTETVLVAVGGAGTVLVAAGGTGIVLVALGQSWRQRSQPSPTPTWPCGAGQ